jgi:hypothetical protein
VLFSINAIHAFMTPHTLKSQVIPATAATTAATFKRSESLEAVSLPSESPDRLSQSSKSSKLYDGAASAEASLRSVDTSNAPSEVMDSASKETLMLIGRAVCLI